MLRGAQNPVLAHLFLNYLQDLPNALTNISYNGYMQPVYGVTPTGWCTRESCRSP